MIKLAPYSDPRKPEDLIQRVLASAAAAELAAYRDMQARLHLIADGEYWSILSAHIRARYPDTADRLLTISNGVASGLDAIDVIDRMLSDLSVVYSAPPSTSLQRNGEVLPEDDPLVVQWREQEELIGLQEVMRQLDRYVYLFRTTLVQVRWVGPGAGYIEWRVWEPYRVRVLQSRIAPERICDDTVIALEIPSGEDSLGPVVPTRHEVWTKGKVWVWEEGGSYTPGKMLRSAVFGPTQQESDNEYGVIPLTVVRHSPPKTGEFFRPPRTGWMQAWLKICEHLIDLAESLTFGAFGQPVVEQQLDIAGEEDMLPRRVGPDKILMVPAGTFNYKQSGTDFAALEQAIEQRLRALAVSVGQAATIWSGETAQRNFNSAVLEWQQLIQERTRMLPIYARAGRSFWAHHRAVHNWHVENDADAPDHWRPYPDDVEMVIKPAPPQMPRDPAQEAQARSQQYAAGTRSPVDDIATDEAVTRPVAEARYWRNLDEVAGKRPGEEVALPGDETPEDPDTAEDDTLDPMAGPPVPTPPNLQEDVDR